MSIEHPAESSYNLECLYNDGNDDVNFQIGMAEKVYSLSRWIRTPDDDYCDTELTCGDVSVTIFMYENKPFGNVRGFFSGTIYEEAEGLSDNCKSSIPHTIDGEFWLVRAN